MLQCNLLDLDGSLGTNIGAGQAVGYSTQKLNLNGMTKVYSGQTTDSGGGGTLDGLAAELASLDLTVPQDDYLVASCGIHCLQLQLSGPTKELIGEGGLDKRNAIQLLHTVYDFKATWIGSKLMS